MTSNHQVIVQTGSDRVSRESAAALAARHADGSTLYAWSTEGALNLLKGALRASPGHGLKVQMVGHGEMGGGHGAVIGGADANDVVGIVNAVQQQFGQPVNKLTLAGCNTAGCLAPAVQAKLPGTLVRGFGKPLAIDSAGRKIHNVDPADPRALTKESEASEAGVPPPLAKKTHHAENNVSVESEDAEAPPPPATPEQSDMPGVSPKSANATPKPTEAQQVRALEKIVDWYRSSTAKLALNDLGKNALKVQQDNFADVVKQQRADLKKEVGPLSHDEQDFLSNFLQQDFYVTHATTGVPENNQGDLLLYSLRGLKGRSIDFESGTTNADAENYGNNDYVFFGLETGATPKKTYSRFGQNFYRAKYDHPAFAHSALMLADPSLKTAQNPMKIEGLSGEGFYRVHTRKLEYAQSISQGRAESLTTLGYKLIDAARKLSPEDRALLLSARTDAQVNNVINGVFRPQIMVPKILALKKGNFELRYHRR